MKLNVIIPMYNEEGNILILYRELTNVLKNIDYELLFINDGSKDNTYKILKEIYDKDPLHVKVINFSRNFGKDSAIYAGLTHSNAEYTVIIDGDCQQNPKYLLTMVDFLDKNQEYDQIAMVNKTRNKENKFNVLLKNAFYSFMNIISETKFVRGASDFRMFRNNMIESINTLPEINRFSKGIFSWVGFNTYYMEYTSQERHSGKTKFNLKNQFKYAFSGIVNFSVRPLKIASVTGLLFSLGAFIYLIIALIQTLSYGIDVPGYAFLISVIILMGGFQLIAIGILGEYIAKAYIETKKRPIYVAKNKLGFKEKNIL